MHVHIKVSNPKIIIYINLHPDLYFSPETATPDKIKKYRDSLRQRIGVKC